MANAFVFVGPSLSVADARLELDAVYLGPAAQGDVYRAAKERPHAIALIDGYFERVPAVWHKEILWALAHGVHVFGGASMGALRAAELASFGMRGVGRIYEAFRSGELEDDDEVAVAHGDASTQYRATSEAMVNIRATLARAVLAGALTEAERVTLEGLAKSAFYADRSYPYIFELAEASGVAEVTVERLRQLVASERVDQKRADALEVLRAVRNCVEDEQRPATVAFSFAHTEAWDQVAAWAEVQPPITGGGEGSSSDLLLAEVRATGAVGHAVLERALFRAVAGAFFRRSRASSTPEVLKELDGRVRLDAGLRDAADFARWLEENHLTPEAYSRNLESQAALEWIRSQFAEERVAHVADELRMRGEYARLVARAQHKEQVLSKHGLGEPSLRDAGIDSAELLRWYCSERLGRSLPRDLVGFLLELGLPDLASLEREALRELLYSRLRERDT